MQHSKTILTYIAFAMFFCFFKPTYVFGQVKAGFQALTKKDTMAAENAFIQDLKSSRKAIVAQFGLLRIHEGRANRFEIDTLLAFADSLQNLQVKLGKLSKWRQRRFEKKYKFTKYNTQIVRNNILTKTSRRIGEEWGTLNYDDFAKKRPELVKDMGNLLKKALRKIVIRDFEESLDYQTLRSVIKKHGQIIQNQNLRFNQDFESRLSGSFIAEYGFDKLGDFIKEFPEHGISKDCWVDELIQLYKKNGRRGGLQFLNKYRFSKLDIFVINDILTHRKELNNLTEEEQERLDALTLNSTIVRGVFRKSNPDTLFNQTLKYIKLEAPSRRSFDLLKMSMQRLVDSCNIILAVRLLDSTKFSYTSPIASKGCAYSINLSWFDIVKSILKRPDTNIVKTPLKTINTTFGHEYSPVISANGKTLYFCGYDRPDMNESNGEKVLVSYFKDNQWTKPVLVKELNSEGNQSPLSLTPDGLTMLLSVNGKLHYSTRTDGKWSASTSLSTINQSFAWIGKATLSPDARVLIFEASKTGSNFYSTSSNIDLYIAFRQGNFWEFPNPVPLPESINKPYGMERSPYLHADGKTLYFASDGHEGMGEIDIYKTTRLDNTWRRWSKPYNIGKNFNTIKDDWGMNLAISAKGDVGLFSSNYNLYHDNDIYTTNVPQAVQPEKLQVLELKIKPPVSNKSKYLMTFYNEKNQIIKRDSVRIEEGQIISVFPKDSAHHFVIENEQIFPINSTITSALGTIDSFKTVSIADMLEKNIAVPIPNIEFDKDKADLRIESLPQLDLLIKFLSDKPWKSTIIGHTDDTGTKDHNMELSYKRALAVSNYVKTKLPNYNITIQGVGSSQPKLQGTSEEVRQINRRVEIKIQK